MFFSRSEEIKRKAIAYYRHSAEDKQENSVGIQRDHIMKFAEKHAIDIIHEEADEGVSGLTANRPAFQRLFNNWILNADAPDFDYILVYDTSRWGRFQDPDRAAFLEQQCRDRAKQVVYVDRGFPKEDQKLISHLQSSIERYMSADYSRQLSNKVFYGAAKVSEQGYSAGGMSCYGMSRLLLDEAKEPIRILKKGEHKMIANQRVTFVPTGDKATDTVKKIFHDLVFRWRELEDIAMELNNNEIPSPSGSPWDKQKVLHILTNETYTGTHIYNKTWNRLKQGKRDNPRSEWIFCYDAFPAIVEQDVFNAAQERLYLLMPRKMNQGALLQYKMQRRVRDELENSFIQQGYDHDSAFTLSNKFPITSSITFYKDKNGPAKWVFMIPWELRRFDYVIGIGISLDEDDEMRNVFALPTELFDEADLLTIQEGGENYSRSIMQKNKVEEWIKDYTKQLDKILCFTTH